MAQVRADAARERGGARKGEREREGEIERENEGRRTLHVDERAHAVIHFYTIRFYFREYPKSVPTWILVPSTF